MKLKLEDVHARFGQLIEAESELAEVKQSLASAQVEAKDLRRRLDAAEEELAAERKSSKAHLTWPLEKWLLKNNAKVSYEATQRGKFKIRLSTGRRADGRAVELLYDPDKTPIRALREAIEAAKAR